MQPYIYQICLCQLVIQNLLCTTHIPAPLMFGTNGLVKDDVLLMAAGFAPAAAVITGPDADITAAGRTGACPLRTCCWTGCGR